MQLERMVDSKAPDFRKAWEIYESEFPADERRDLSKQDEVLGRKEYRFFAVLDKKAVVGLLAAWNFEDFVFIEHYAIRRDLQNQGLGTRLLRAFIDRDERVVLETERPKTSIARRRIRFYERLKFKLNRHDYTQPSYSPDKNPVPMFLMSFPESLSVSEFTEIRRSLHTQVYCLEKPLI